MILINKGDFSISQMELINQYVEELSSFFQGTGTMTISTKKNKKGKIKVSVEIAEGESKIQLEAISLTIENCLIELKYKTNQILNEITDNIMTNAERINEINVILKNEQIH